MALLVKTAPPRKSLHGAAALHGHMGGFRKVFARFSRGFREAFARLSLPKYFRERFRRAEKFSYQFLRAAGAPARGAAEPDIFVSARANLSLKYF